MAVLHLPRLKVRPEAYSYLQSYEALLSLAATAHPTLSGERMRIVKYYVEELAKMASQFDEV